VPDVYATITEADQATQERLADVLELRAADAQQRSMLDSYLTDVAFPKDADVLEVGCGSGAVSRALARWPAVGRVVGLDPSAVLLERAQQLNDAGGRLSFVEGDARALPFAAVSFDVIVLHTTLCHIPGPERVLAEAFRVCRSGGQLAVFDGDYATTTVAIGERDPLQQCADAAMEALVHDRWLVRRLPALAAAAGFQVHELRSHGFTESAAPQYMLTIVDRGADALRADRRISPDTAKALKDEARHRVQDGTFFGHIAYASLLATRPAGS
jgi:ubiquinone/menaquinone biosynthesis C-methylase UbiE